LAEPLPAPTCSAISRGAGEPLIGTASTVRAWVLLQQPGPWGAEALLQSRLEPGFASELAARAQQARVRVLLIRRYGSGASPARPHCFVAYTGPRMRFVEERQLDRHEDLLDLDLVGLRRGERPGFGQAVERPLYLVCTNGRHDRCCATYGRPLAQSLSPSFGGRVWECSHIGGDRFAGNLLCLPHGLYFGGLGSIDGHRVAEQYERGLIDLEHYRGRCSQAPAVQAAEYFVRDRHGLRHVDDLTLERRDLLPGGDVTARFSSRSGARYHVHVAVRPSAQARPLTCKAERLSFPPEYHLLDLQVGL
jgi:hypothetical protein